MLPLLLLFFSSSSFAIGFWNISCGGQITIPVANPNAVATGPQLVLHHLTLPNAAGDGTAGRLLYVNGSSFNTERFYRVNDTFNASNKSGYIIMSVPALPSSGTAYMVYAYDCSGTTDDSDITILSEGHNPANLADFTGSASSTAISGGFDVSVVGGGSLKTYATNQNGRYFWVFNFTSNITTDRPTGCWGDPSNRPWSCFVWNGSSSYWFNSNASASEGRSSQKVAAPPANQKALYELDMNSSRTFARVCYLNGSCSVWMNNSAGYQNTPSNITSIGVDGGEQVGVFMYGYTTNYVGEPPSTSQTNDTSRCIYDPAHCFPKNLTIQVNNSNVADLAAPGSFGLSAELCLTDGGTNGHDQSWFYLSGGALTRLYYYRTPNWSDGDACGRIIINATTIPGNASGGITISSFIGFYGNASQPDLSNAGMTLFSSNPIPIFGDFSKSASCDYNYTISEGVRYGINGSAGACVVRAFNQTGTSRRYFVMFRLNSTADAIGRTRFIGPGDWATGPAGGIFIYNTSVANITTDTHSGSYSGLPTPAPNTWAWLEVNFADPNMSARIGANGTWQHLTNPPTAVPHTLYDLGFSIDNLNEMDIGFYGSTYNFSGVEPNYTVLYQAASPNISISSVSVSPTIANKSANVSCNVSVACGGSASVCNVSYEWHLNGANQSALAAMAQDVSTSTASLISNLTPSQFSKGQNWSCNVKAVNATGNATGWNMSANNTIQNSIPTLSSSLAFTNATAGHWFYANFTGDDLDGYADMTWWQLNSSSGTCINFSNLSSANSTALVFNCSATGPSTPTLNATINDSSGAQANATSSNAYPDLVSTLTNTSITPATIYLTTTPITCNLGILSDADGDIENATARTYEWYLNGTAIANSNSSTLTNSSFGGTDSLICGWIATVDNWNESRAFTNSSPVVVINSSFTANYSILVSSLAQANQSVLWTAQANVSAGSGTLSLTHTINGTINATTILDANGVNQTNIGNLTTINWTGNSSASPYNLTISSAAISQYVETTAYTGLGGAYQRRVALLTAGANTLSFNFSYDTGNVINQRLWLCTGATNASCVQGATFAVQPYVITNTSVETNLTLSKNETVLVLTWDTPSGSPGPSASGGNPAPSQPNQPENQTNQTQPAPPSALLKQELPPVPIADELFRLIRVFLGGNLFIFNISNTAVVVILLVLFIILVLLTPLDGPTAILAYFLALVAFFIVLALLHFYSAQIFPPELVARLNPAPS